MTQPNPRTTPIYGWPTPSPGQADDVPAVMQDLAEAIEGTVSSQADDIAEAQAQLVESARIAVVQALDQTNPSTAVAPSTDLVVPVLAGAVYVFQARIAYAAEAGGIGGAGRAKFSWAVPAGTTMDRQSLSIAGSNTTTSGDGDKTFNSRGGRSHTSEQLAGGPGFTGNGAYWEDSIVTVGGTAGNVTLQFALNDSSSEPATLRAGSFVLALRVA